MHSPILAPLVALVLWSFVMGAWLYATRIPAMIRNNIRFDPRRPDAEFHDQMPATVRWKADNYNHLMEQPTLFYAVALTLALLGAGKRIAIALKQVQRMAVNGMQHRRMKWIIQRCDLLVTAVHGQCVLN